MSLADADSFLKPMFMRSRWPFLAGCFAGLFGGGLRHWHWRGIDDPPYCFVEGNPMQPHIDLFWHICYVGVRLDWVDFTRFSSGIKASKSKGKRFPGRIRELAEKDITQAILLAARGVQFTELQQLASHYWHFQKELSYCKSGKAFLSRKEIRKHVRECEEIAAGYENKLVGVFLSALRAGDADKLREIGNAIEFVQSFKVKTQDRQRRLILDYKRMLDQTGDCWTIGDLALRLKRDRREAVNGYATLRRMAEELKFPLCNQRS
jgi:hypothetical protein